MNSPAITNHSSDLTVSEITPSVSLSRRTTSTVWKYCASIPGNAQLKSHDPKKLWKCQVCMDSKRITTYKYCNGTTPIIKHLRISHRINLNTTNQDKAEASVQQLNGILNWTSSFEPRIKRRKTTHGSSELDPDILRELYGRYVSDNNLPLDHCSNSSFRVLLQYVNEAANQLLPRGDSTIKVDFDEIYRHKKLAIQESLRTAISSIHLTPDNWTTPNHLAVMGVVAHYVSVDHGLQHIVLGIRELHGTHSGENMAEILWELLKDFDIIDKIGYIMADNAGNNGTMCKDLAKRFRQEGIPFDAIKRRLSCNGHVINLSVLAFLFGKHPDSKDEAYAGPSQDEIQDWRSCGPHGKLHNIVIYVQGSEQRRESFKEHSGGQSLCRDNKTRWNSWYTMIERALKPNVKAAIRSYCGETPDLENDTLSRDDWKTLADIYDILKPFLHTTKATEGSNHSIDRIIPSFDYLLNHYEACVINYKDNPYILSAIQTGCQKLKEYYSKSDQSPAYVAAVVLNPAYKWAYFEDNWKTPELKAWIPVLKDALQEIWTSTYKSTVSVPSELAPDSPTESTSDNGFLDFWETDANLSLEDEYALYLRERVLRRRDVKSGLLWWQEPTQRRRFPNLSQMAIDILSIPAMAADVERLFSTAKLTITPQRNCLHISTLELLQCLKSWDNSSVLNATSLVSLSHTIKATS